MPSRKYILSAAALMTAIVFALATAASAQAKEGTWSGTYSGFGTSKAVQIGEERLLTVFDENGLFVSDGMFDHTTWHCWGLADFTNGMGQAHGYCVGTDPAGDQVVLDFVSEKHPLAEKSFKGSFTVTAGAGKYAGISGSGTYVSDGNMFRPTEKGTYFGHNTAQGSYKLP